jgi:hypothetical protein
MAWLHNGRTIKVGKSWVSDDNKKYPRQWNRLTNEQKTSAGLVWQDDPVVVKYDNRFYWAAGVERSLEDINVVDDDGNAVIDPITNVQMIQLGLKSQWIERTKSTANGLLTASDWYVVRKSETDTAIPTDIATYRAAVRTATGTIETAINACADLDAFKALFVVPTDADGNPSGNAPIYDFPDEV